MYVQPLTRQIAVRIMLKVTLAADVQRCTNNV